HSSRRRGAVCTTARLMRAMTDPSMPPLAPSSGLRRRPIRVKNARVITLACHRCRHEFSGERVGVRAVCEACGGPLHTCRNCTFWEPRLANECREPGAERVADKEQGNFCDFFRPAA